jgi:glycerol-3-phosphate dehydrogenase
LAAGQFGILVDYSIRFILINMNRDAMLARLRSERCWDIVIIGGGATGLGAAVDAAARGYKVLLCERDDFAKGTSSRSTKLVHGGVRYLQQGNIKLVLEALRERGRLMQNAPHLVHNLSFIVPLYKWWESPYYGIGLKIYDWMAGKWGFGSSEWLSKEETLERLPNLDPEGLRGGVVYYDGQFDDARLAINLAQTAAEQGGCLINYLAATGFVKNDGVVSGVHLHDVLGDEKFTVQAKVVINATGVFTDEVLQMDDAGAENIIMPSQGIHLVFDKTFLPGNSAVMVPHTDDGRVLFAVPWHNKVVVGTTDTPLDTHSTEPRALEEEIIFVMKHITRYLHKDPVRSDVKAVFAGLRPLVKSGAAKNTAAISRDHLILVSAGRLITITGGKWTTYRKMAEDVIDKAAELAALKPVECKTKTLRIHGYDDEVQHYDAMYYYGTDRLQIVQLMEADAGLRALLHPALPYTKAEVVWAVRKEMAMRLEDVLARRTRALFLDAAAARAMAPAVAELMMQELGKDEAWKRAELAAFEQVAAGYEV